MADSHWGLYAPAPLVVTLLHGHLFRDHSSDAP